MSQNYQYNTIEEALRDLKKGKIVLVTDDPDRENEGDLICAAEFATRENINFMATYAKGLICTPMSAEIAARLNFPPMVAGVNYGQSQHSIYRGSGSRRYNYRYLCRTLLYHYEVCG